MANLHVTDVIENVDPGDYKVEVVLKNPLGQDIVKNIVNVTVSPSTPVVPVPTVVID